MWQERVLDGQLVKSSMKLLPLESVWRIHLLQRILTKLTFWRFGRLQWSYHCLIWNLRKVGAGRRGHSNNSLFLVKQERESVAPPERSENPNQKKAQFSCKTGCKSAISFHLSLAFSLSAICILDTQWRMRISLWRYVWTREGRSVIWHARQSLLYFGSSFVLMFFCVCVLGFRSADLFKWHCCMASHLLSLSVTGHWKAIFCKVTIRNFIIYVLGFSGWLNDIR